MSQQALTLPLYGGLDLVTPAIRTATGRAIAGNNYEPEARGYARVGGYERLDGHNKPSLATYHIIQFDAGQTAISEGDTITGATSGATAVALYDVTEATGTFAGGDATGEIILVNLSGVFEDNENLQVSAATVAVADGVATARGATTDTLDSTYYRAAIEYRRALIAAVPGSGAVRGAWVYNGVQYAFRDNVGGTACVMHKATSAGWVEVTLSLVFGFDAGTAEFSEGETITGGTSGATAVVRRILVDSGSWGANDAAGRLIVDTVSGTFVDNETITGGTSSGSATSDGIPVQTTLTAGGKYRFTNHNFYGASDRFRMYGVNGLDRGFEFDGVAFIPIVTGMVDDTPSHVAAHRGHLFFAFAGGSLQHSAIGNPHSFSINLGSGELGLGSDVTNLLPDTDTAMAVYARNKVAVLFGDGAANWILKTLSDDAGAIADTAQRVGKPIYMDDRGLRSLAATQDFGDFKMGTITQLIEPLFALKQKQGVTPVGSIRVRTKDQYRVYFSDGTGITVYFGRKVPEALPFNLGFTVSSIVSAENSDGSEILLAGADDGFVYELDAGTSFDGGVVNAFLRLAFNHLGAPTYRKLFHKATFEIDVTGPMVLGIIAEFGYADPNQPPSVLVSSSLAGGGGFWDEANWDEFYWSAPLEGLAEAYIDGIGRNVSITAVSSATHEQPHVLQGLTLNFSKRGLVR